MHGFPDNVHLYDRLLPYLSPPRRVIAFDFLGWGSSDKPTGYAYTASNQVGDLDAVITQLRLDQVILVAHDASGPPAIDWALDHSERVAALVLLNTYYCEMPTLRPPEAIWLFSTPVVRNIARPISLMFGRAIFRRMYDWQVGRFFRDAEVRRICATAVSTVRCDAKCSSCVLSFERRLVAYHTITHQEDPAATRVQTAGQDHLRRLGSLLE